ncbi:hypothetical protein K504DRAFT_531763 [Pleomassaria siparia CBS 279.74]|uniref:Uncharacterized protein n=1 Tax=Pleomassaria siparia CBS 279.74 TaxID=1314801 RepID=A0A6G1KIH0_9PLEO|nr:hypothetical protein K504DRAFT_531763 [Pleomassaria siparia CBS 279.74]
MFVPRALRLKGVREPERSRKPPVKKSHIKPNTEPETESSIDEVITAMRRTSTSHSTLPPPEQIESTKAFSGPRYTAPTIPSDYLGKLFCGIELLFTDHAHQHKDGSRWLEKHYRVADGEEKYVHLSAILEHPNISTLKPEATQLLLRQAIQESGSDTLELSESGYLVRRRPSTYPLRFVPSDSFSVFNDDGLSFWDQRTIYVEPHTRDLCKTPARVAYWLKTHGQMKEKWFPIQAVHTIYNSCAFVVLSGNVTHQGVWQKWRELDKPEHWKIMTKVEHTKRTIEYLVELKKAKPWLKTKGPNGETIEVPQEPIVKQLTPAATIAQDDATNRKRKRGKRKDKSTNEPRNRIANHAEAADEDDIHVGPVDKDGINGEAQELTHEPQNKKLKASG